VEHVPISQKILAVQPGVGSLFLKQEGDCAYGTFQQHPTDQIHLILSRDSSVLFEEDLLLSSHERNVLAFTFVEPNPRIRRIVSPLLNAPDVALLDTQFVSYGWAGLFSVYTGIMIGFRSLLDDKPSFFGQTIVKIKAIAEGLDAAIKKILPRKWVRFVRRLFL
jgi:hypothetical protein